MTVVCARGSTQRPLNIPGTSVASTIGDGDDRNARGSARFPSSVPSSVPSLSRNGNDRRRKAAGILSWRFAEASRAAPVILLSFRCDAKRERRFGPDRTGPAVASFAAIRESERKRNPISIPGYYFGISTSVLFDDQLRPRETVGGVERMKTLCHLARLLFRYLETRSMSSCNLAAEG